MRGKLPRKDNLWNIGVDIDAGCPYCGSQLEDINHLFRQCLCTRDLERSLGVCPNSINCSMHFLDWIEWQWNFRNVYNKSYHCPVENIFVIEWSIWNFRIKLFSISVMNLLILMIWRLIVLTN